MRYDNWDVILFPKDSAVPIQEFRTAFRVSHDEQARQLPTLTCYVASLPPATPFRISIHSWDNPAKPSAFIESRRKNDQKVVYTIQVTMDGTMIYHGFFDVSSRWPQEIANEKRSFNEPHSLNQRHPSLEFPLFHPHILMQRAWSVGESHGRIKVLLSEQLLATDGDSGELQPAISNDIVCFAFQHTPKDILEQFGISWPIHNPLYLASSSPQGPQVPMPFAKARGPIIHPSLPQHFPSTFAKAHMQDSSPRPGMNPTQLSSFSNSMPGGRMFRSGLRNSSLTDSLSESYENMSADSWSGKHPSSHSTVDTSHPSMMYTSPAHGMPFSNWNFTDKPNGLKPSRSDGSKIPRQVVVTLREDQLGQLIGAISPPKEGRERDTAGQRTATGVHSKHTLGQLQTPSVSGRVVSRPSAAALARIASHQNNGLYTLRKTSPDNGQDAYRPNDKENRLQPPSQSQRVPTPHPFVIPTFQWEPDAALHRTSTLASDLSRDGRKRPTSKEGKGSPSFVYTSIKSRKEGLRGSKASPIHLDRHDGSTLPTVDLTTNEDDQSCEVHPTKPPPDYLEDVVNGEVIDKVTRPGHKDSISSLDSTDQLERKLYSALGEELSFRADAQPVQGGGNHVGTDGSLLDGFDIPIMKRKRQGSVGSEDECSPISKMAKEVAEDAGLEKSLEVPHLRGGV